MLFGVFFCSCCCCYYLVGVFCSSILGFCLLWWVGVFVVVLGFFVGLFSLGVFVVLMQINLFNVFVTNQLKLLYYNTGLVWVCLLKIFFCCLFACLSLVDCILYVCLVLFAVYVGGWCCFGFSATTI